MRVVVFRKRVAHQSRRNYQLDLFSPDDGHFEYSAVATNLTLSPRALWNFTAGRGAQEKTFAELKGRISRSTPFPPTITPLTAAMAAAAPFWPTILTIGFQLHSNLATAKPSTAKRTYSYWLVSMKTLRFTVINRAARVARIHGCKDPALFLPTTPPPKSFHDQVLDRLANIYTRDLFSL